MVPLDAPTAGTERDCRIFAGVLASVTSARRFVVEALGGTPKPLLEAIELMVSELASNCVLHTAAEFEVCIVRGERTVRVEVTDTGRGLPVLRQPAAADLRGRGLVIVKELADEWGIVHQVGHSGKMVWFAIRQP
jgi:anti-sigma regulatory factor (Ser/Thr protein kinase)